LHHFLYGIAATGDEALPTAAELAHELETLPAAERAPLAAAIAAYREHFGTRDLLDDPELAAIKASLAAGETAAFPALPPSSSEAPASVPNLGALLAQAAEPYRVRLWPAHEAQNRRWVDAAAGLLRAHGAGIVADLERWYRTPWPTG